MTPFPQAEPARPHAGLVDAVADRRFAAPAIQSRRTPSRAATVRERFSVPGCARLRAALRPLAIPVVLLSWAAAPRFYQVTAVGIRFDDEAAYAADARLWHRCLRFLGDAEVRSALGRGDAGAVASACQRLGIDPKLRYAKPCQGYTFLAAAMMFVAGDRPETLALLNAVLGTLTVMVVYTVAARILGATAGLCAGLALAVSPYHLLYSRTAFADGAAVFFIMLGVWYWLLASRVRSTNSRRSFYYVILSGLALGYSVTCHFRSGNVPALLAIFELTGLMLPSRGAASRRSRMMTWLKRWAVFSLAFVAPALVIEAAFRAARYGAEALGFTLPLATFAESWIYWARLSYEVDTGVFHASLNLNAAWAFVEYMVHWHGLPAAVAIGAGMVLTLRRRRAARLPTGVIVATLVMMLFQNHAVARAYAVLLPFAAMGLGAAAGAAAQRLTRVSRREAPLAAVLTLLVAIPAIRASVQAIQKHSGIAHACAFLRAQDEPAAVPTLSKYALYLDGAPAPARPGDLFYRTYRDVEPQAALADMRRQGVRWLVTDPQYFHYRADDSIHLWWNAMTAYLDATLSPAAAFPHMSDFRWEFQAEGPGLHRVPALTAAAAGPIRIYDLNRVTTADGAVP